MSDRYPPFRLDMGGRETRDAAEANAVRPEPAPAPARRSGDRGRTPSGANASRQ